MQLNTLIALYTPKTENTMAEFLAFWRGKMPPLVSKERYALPCKEALA